MSPNDWRGDFGDGTSGTGQNPDHVYRKEGVYTVRLTASDGYSSNTLTKKDYITIINIPSADFSADKTKGISPLTVYFTDKSTANPTEWNWNFGDGTTSALQNPMHVYTTHGTAVTNQYTVTLTATNVNGQGTETRLDYITVTQTPIADFTVDDRQGKAPFIVKFHDISAGNPTRWTWEFGDAGTSSEQNPTHVYPFEGSYDIRLTVTNQYGSDTIFKTGSTSQRGNATPIIMPVFVDVTPMVTSTSVYPVQTMATTVPVTASMTSPTATQTPLPALVPVAASIIGLLAIAATKRK
jgi:PKD repeat protein